MPVDLGSKEQYSIKPFLLDAIMGWCQVNKLTPILVTGHHDARVLPDHLRGSRDDLSFNISPKAVFDKTVSTEAIVFSTYFRNSSMPQRIVLPSAAWKAVRVKETQQYFDLAFPEQFLPQMIHWPLGVHLSDPQALLAPPQRAGTQAQSDAATESTRRPKDHTHPQSSPGQQVGNQQVYQDGPQGAQINPVALGRDRGSKKAGLSLVWDRDRNPGADDAKSNTK